jgi:hypothetical protein
MLQTTVARTAVIAAMILWVAATSLWAQRTSRAGTIRLIARLPEPLSVDISSVATIHVKLTSSSTPSGGGTTFTILTTWVLAPGRSKVRVWAWVADSAAALTDGDGDTIPASALTAIASGSGSPGGPLNTSAGGGGIPAFPGRGRASGVGIGDVPITPANVASRTTTTLTWNIDDTAMPKLTQNSYVGTVNLQVEAAP